MIPILFLLGLSVGSFLNVLIDRIPKSEPITWGRSYCDHCKHPLAWSDLIPLLSFFLLKRKCRYCGKKISWQYPIVELISGLLFLFTFATMIYIIEAELFFAALAYYLIVIAGLVVIFFTDLKYRIIPDQILLILTAASTLFLFLSRSSFINHFLSGVVTFFIFLFLVIITRGKGMGLGDVKFVFVIGLILGFPLIMVSLYLSFLTGAVISLILVIWGKKTIKSTIPFGPFLVLATLVSLFYGESLWRLFQKIIGI